MFGRILWNRERKESMSGKAFVPVLCFLFVMTVAVSSYAAGGFEDVPAGHWAYAAIRECVDAGILKGHDGRFDGGKLLNRYQMAEIVKNLLDRMEKMAEGGAAISEQEFKHLQALTIEFADELALLNVKVSTLEDDFAELKKAVEAGKAGAVKAKAGEGVGGGLSAMLQLGLVVEDDATSGYITGYCGDDDTAFVVPQFSMGFDGEIDENLVFHGHVDYAVDNKAQIAGVPIGDNRDVTVNEAYVVAETLGDKVAGKFGIFALPMAQDINGPFRTCNWTLTPSALSITIEWYRLYGMALSSSNEEDEQFYWEFGLAANTDADTLPWLIFLGWTDYPVPATLSGEDDDGFGYYLFVGRKPEADSENKFSWSLGYFDNGGDRNAPASHTATNEVDFFVLNFQYWTKDFGFIGAYLDGSSDVAGGTDDYDMTTWYLLVNYKVDEKTSVSLRYEDYELEIKSMIDKLECHTVTFAVNRRMSDHGLLQFEYLSPDVKENSTFSEVDDDMLQVRYKVFF